MLLKPLSFLVTKLPAPLRRRVVDGAVEFLWGRFARLTVEGKAHLPEGACLFVANHLSNADGITLSRALAPRRVHFLAGVKLHQTPLTRLGLEAVDIIEIRPGTADIEAIRKALALLKQGDSVLLFPEGTRSRDGRLQEARRGAALIATKAKVPVVPVAVTGTEVLLPIDDADMGGEHIQHADVLVRIGEAIDVAELQASLPEGAEPRQALVDALMRKIAELLPERYRGHYRD